MPSAKNGRAYCTEISLPSVTFGKDFVECFSERSIPVVGGRRTMYKRDRATHNVRCTKGIGRHKMHETVAL
jgi:hypothetical protein